MDQEFSQMDIAKCKEHPQMVISFIYCKDKCPYKSCLACNKCMKEYNKFYGFEDVLDLLQDPKAILNKFDRPIGKYDQLMEYFNLLEQDPKNHIYSLTQNIMKQIQKLEIELKEGIEKYNIFREEIAKAKQQFNEVLGYEYYQFRQVFKEILKVENYHLSGEWKKFENKVQNYVLQFVTQNNQELTETYYKLQQMEKTFFEPQLLSDFKKNVTKNVESMCRQLRVFPRYSTLCDPLYFSELINRIFSQRNETPTINLIYQGSRDGMNAKMFQQKCHNKGPTIIFCKSMCGHVFGGYTPCKWQKQVKDLEQDQLNQAQQKYQQDDSKTSFLFSYTRKEIYPILQSENAISYRLNYGPSFGNAPDLQITDNFQNGCSNLTGQCYSIEKYKIENFKLHLMGGKKPNLVEMEVFLVQ